MNKTSETTPATEPNERREQPGKTPRTLGRYRVQGVLGSGGMGTVYAAFDDRLQRRVAIKQLRRRNHDEVVRRRFVREAQILARLPHPNIVAVYEWFELDGQLAIVMEYVEGRTLRDWIADTRPTHADILAVLRGAGRGIVAAHEAGLIHRDLKPDNIMVGDDGRVRVMDFGVARALDLGDDEARDTEPSLVERGLTGSLTSTGAVLGTPGYAAPEQLLGLAVDARADVFGFCVLAYESIHGGRPFVGRDAEAVRRATLGGRIRVVEGSRAPSWSSSSISRSPAPIGSGASSSTTSRPPAISTATAARISRSRSTLAATPGRCCSARPRPGSSPG